MTIYKCGACGLKKYMSSFRTTRIKGTERRKITKHLCKDCLRQERRGKFCKQYGVDVKELGEDKFFCRVCNTVLPKTHFYQSFKANANRIVTVYTCKHCLKLLRESPNPSAIWNSPRPPLNSEPEGRWGYILKASFLKTMLQSNGDLDLRRYRGKAPLPKDFTVPGDLILSDLCIDSLPSGWVIQKNLILKGATIRTLPADIEIKGSCDLQKTQIESLPKNFKVGGSLDLEESSLTTLPEGLYVGGHLFLKGSGVKNLPKEYYVDGFVSGIALKRRVPEVEFKLNPSLSVANTRMSAMAYHYVCAIYCKSFELKETFTKINVVMNLVEEAVNSVKSISELEKLGLQAMTPSSDTTLVLCGKKLNVWESHLIGLILLKLASYPGLALYETPAPETPAPETPAPETPAPETPAEILKGNSPMCKTCPEEAPMFAEYPARKLPSTPHYVTPIDLKEVPAKEPLPKKTTSSTREHLEEAKSFVFFLDYLRNKLELDAETLDVFLLFLSDMQIYTKNPILQKHLQEQHERLSTLLPE